VQKAAHGRAEADAGDVHVHALAFNALWQGAFGLGALDVVGHWGSLRVRDWPPE